MRFEYEVSRNEYDVYVTLDDDPTAGEVLAGNLYHDSSNGKWYYDHISDYTHDEDALRSIANKLMQLKLMDSQNLEEPNG